MRDEYAANDYHQPQDQIKPGWNLSGGVQDLQLRLTAGYRAAGAETYPAWRAGNEFKAVRDQQLGRTQSGAAAHPGRVTAVVGTTAVCLPSRDDETSPVRGMSR